MNKKIGDIDINAVRSYWVVEAEDSLKVADHLFEKEDFSYALFFGHLAIEKMLKALYVIKNKKHAPPIHNLVRLARSTNANLDEERISKLSTITTFNIEARYPDLKRKFRLKCTKVYTNKNLNMIKDCFAWLKFLLT